MQLQQSTAATFFTAIAAINAATNGNAAACDLRGTTATAATTATASMV